MWEEINTKFKKYPARMAVAQKMIELGLRVDKNNKIYCDNLKISDAALAKSAGVDRRVIKSTIETITKDEELSNIFGNITPAGTLLKNIAKNLGLGVIEIEVGEDNEGILAAASALIYAGINLLVKFLTAKLTKSGKISKEDADKINSTADDLADDGKINGSNVDK